MIIKSPFVATFDSNNARWEPTREYNELFLRSVMNHMNQLLQIRGHVFLNEVYDALELPRTSHGAVVGWLYQTVESVSDQTGDGYIDFDLKFLDDGGIEIDFNVDGVIYDALPGGSVL